MALVRFRPERGLEDKKPEISFFLSSTSARANASALAIPH
jgi:hypothetical protein